MVVLDYRVFAVKRGLEGVGVRRRRIHSVLGDGVLETITKPERAGGFATPKVDVHIRGEVSWGCVFD